MRTLEWTRSTTIRLASCTLAAALANMNSLARAADHEDSDLLKRLSGQPVYRDADHGQPQMSRTDRLASGPKSLLGFTESRAPDEPPDSSFDIQLNLIAASGERAAAVACEVEGGSPSLRAYFYANADAQPDLEIGVICGWDAPHRGADCNQNDEVRFFKVKTASGRLAALEQIQNETFKSFYGKKKSPVTPTMSCDVAKFKTVADVKKLLGKIKF